MVPESGKFPKPKRKLGQLILLIIEIILFLAAWMLLFFGIFSGYFAFILIIISGVMIFISFRGKSDED